MWEYLKKMKTEDWLMVVIGFIVAFYFTGVLVGEFSSKPVTHEQKMLHEMKRQTTAQERIADVVERQGAHLLWTKANTPEDAQVDIGSGLLTETPR